MKLEIGFNGSFEVRNEQYISGDGASFNILHLSDFHFNTFSKSITEKIITTIKELNPDIILLGGDYADSKNGLVYLKLLLESCAVRQNVFAVAGNHDYYFGLDCIKKMMLQNNICWIEKESFTFKLKGQTIQIDGNKTNLKNVGSNFSILLLHIPVNIVNFAHNYNMVFAGHLHGCQFVFWQTAKGLYPGKLFYKWNILKTKINNCYYFISKGLGDTLPVRFNCFKDMIFVQIKSSKSEALK
jgi:predicted MPP superfamily phosphohydrolase